MYTKKFIPCIYLWQGKAVNPTESTQGMATLPEEDPVHLAAEYCAKGADALLVYDLGTAHTTAADEAEHEQALDLMKAICESSEVEVYGGGRIYRMEDVKKILYAGCAKAILNFDDPAHVALAEEVALKFGKEKLLAACSDAVVLKAQKDVLGKELSGILLRNSALLWEAMLYTDLPLYLDVEEISLSSLLEAFGLANVAGLTGKAANDNAKSFMALKDVCLANNLPVNALAAAYPWSAYQKNSDGLVPVIVQDVYTNQVLMMAYMNEEAYRQTLKSGKMCYYSRSRKEQWLKGETSGHYQYVKALLADCDMDTILAKVSQVGVACHTGAKSCFFHEVAKKEMPAKKDGAGADASLETLNRVYAIIKDRKANPKEGSYTNYLFDKGIDKILKKLGEEATEIVIAAKNPNPNEVKYEISDFLYHCMVLMAEKNISWEEIAADLAKR